MQLRNRKIEVPLPSKEHAVMFVDTETTGLIRQGQPKPHILQLAYILYDTNKNVIFETYNKYIKLPSDVTIDPESIKVHKITREKLDKLADVTIEEAMAEFREACKKVSKIVGHNVAFERALLGEVEDEVLWYCTMKNAVRNCNLIKYPKLNELYKYLYKKESKRLHDAYEDTKVCMKCYLKIK